MRGETTRGRAAESRFAGPCSVGRANPAHSPAGRIAWLPGRPYPDPFRCAANGDLRCGRGLQSRAPLFPYPHPRPGFGRSHGRGRSLRGSCSSEHGGRRARFAARRWGFPETAVPAAKIEMKRRGQDRDGLIGAVLGKGVWIQRRRAPTRSSARRGRFRPSARDHDRTQAAAGRRRLAPVM